MISSHRKTLMTPDKAILDLAPHEFDTSLGEVALQLDEGEGIFYGFFLKQFIAGVRYVLDTPDPTEGSIEAESAIRYFIAPSEDFGRLEPESQAATGMGSSLAFRYGAHWALRMRSEDQH